MHGWRFHAHAVMRNISIWPSKRRRRTWLRGVHWLLGTFSTRFDRFREERGHLFQGRYKAILVEDAAALACVVDYIHLNPVRAGFVR
jgi:putative transposase